MPAASDGQSLEPIDVSCPNGIAEWLALLCPLALRRRRDHHAAPPRAEGPRP